MAQAAWEKPAVGTNALPRSTSRLPFLIGGVLILAAVVYLIVTSTIAGGRFFITVDELLANPAYQNGATVRFTGAVIGSTIQYDSQNLILEFEVAHVPAVTEDLGEALHLAANDPTAQRIRIRFEGVMPDQTQHEAQAIVAGTMGADGVFHATELQFKCPTRFGEATPELGNS